MLMRGSRVNKSHNPTLHFTGVIALFHKRWFSLSCLCVQVVLDNSAAFYNQSSIPRFQRFSCSICKICRY